MAEQITTFWKFINSYEIEIPIIQRDYAQGRLGKEYLYLRKAFLANIRQALDNDEKKMKLDFVYGSTMSGGEQQIFSGQKREKLQPLDGQQRLTTMWLLHWYIALRAGKLDEDICSKLRNFRYETRISSREFCKNLCRPENFKSFSGDGIVEFIKNSTWFYSAWEQDPTIQSMLRMLGGTKKNGKGNKDIVDGIEELFVGKEAAEFVSYWEKLTEEDKIVFYYLSLGDFGLSDDLYVKMNARGKQLTAFENFKADLIGYMREKAEEAEGEENKLRWKTLLEVDAKGEHIPIPIKMDTKWLDIFWENRSDKNNVDEIYFAFLNRFFWNELFVARKGSSKEYVLRVGDGLLSDGERTSTIENENISYSHLNEDNYNEYAALAPYKYLDNEIPVQLFENLQKVLDNYSKYTKKYKGMNPEWKIPCAEWIEGFQFIPMYRDEKSKQSDSPQVTTLSQAQRIVFFALCKYFKEESEEDDADDTSLKRWMRVVCNLVSGVDETGHPQIRSVEAVRSAIDDIEKLDSHNVYDSLCNPPSEKNITTDFGRRWTEEILKAGKILKEGDSEGSEWEEKIVEAEKYAFFHGSIRFMFVKGVNSEGDCWLCDWDTFDEKFKNVKGYFKDTESNDSWMRDEFNNAELLKALVRRFDVDDFSVLNWNHRTFNNKYSSWLYYLLSSKICDHVHSLLCDGINVTHRKPSDDFQENILYLIAETGLLEYVMEEIPYSWIRTYHNHEAIYQRDRGIFLDAGNRNDFLLNTDGVTIDDSCKIPHTNLLYGTNINFKYGNKPFQWYFTDFIYMMKDDQYKDYLVKDESKTNDTDRWYCFKAKDETRWLSGEEILKGMDKLINEAEERAKEEMLE